MQDRSAPPPLPSGPIRVAVVSADPVYVQTLTEFLRRRGIEVSRAGADAASGLDLDRVDVLLVETHGAAADEWALLERVRRQAPLVEVVAISSDPLVREAVRALRAGLYAVLQYPVSGDQLAETIAGAGTRKRRAEVRMRQLNGNQEWQGGRAGGRRRRPSTEPREGS